jgi:hypothetical protein
MKRQTPLALALALLLLPAALLHAEPTADKPAALAVSRSAYGDKLHGFWLGQCIANWTGLRTEGHRNKAPFYTNADWGTTPSDKPGRKRIDFVLVEQGKAWGADDDTDIEYIYQDLLLQHKASVLSPEQIRAGWLEHIKTDEPNALWVSNESALHLMAKGMLPPDTSLPKHNKNYSMIDAQLTTELFGLLAPGRPDVALKMAHLPIRVTAYRDAQWIAEFYVVMHALASVVDDEQSMHEQVMWLADQARHRLPDESYAAKIYDFVLRDYQNNPDKDDWERTRDALYERYQANKAGADGYAYSKFYDAGINFGASLVSLFYGQGDYKRTVQIGCLCGWDSDNPTATWGGLLGFMLGRKGIEQLFPDVALSGLYHIGRTRINFPDRTPDQPGDDRFALMAERGLAIIDRVVAEEMGGGVDQKRGLWLITPSALPIEPASDDE